MPASQSVSHGAEHSGENILVAGGGPAGCAVAIGLVRLGYPVSLLHSPRRWTGCEGISERTLQGLRNAGLAQAAATAHPASARRAHWNGVASEANSEYLLLRPEFDAALLLDARQAGVDVLPGLLRKVGEGEEGRQAEYQDAGGVSLALPCRFFVDARGRSSTGRGEAARKGPTSLSLLQHRLGPPREPASQLHSFDSGWAWAANTSDGQVFVQMTVDADAVELPGRPELAQWFEQQLQQLPELAAACTDTLPQGKITARASTSLLQAPLLSSTSLRVGDAAMAVDPLSGNGIFQALSSALSAPAVINTLLQRPQDAELAAEFYRSRVEHMFKRFTRTGRDFYRMESRWPDSPFWRERSHWPDDQPSHSELPPALQGVERRPVIEGGYIVERPVAITSDQPLGVWHVAGVELAPLLQDLPDEREQRSAVLRERLEQLCPEEGPAKQAVSAWLRRYRVA